MRQQEDTVTIEANNDAAFCRTLVSYRRFPFNDVDLDFDHAARRAAIGRCCRSLEKDGCVVIKNLPSRKGLRLLLREAVERKPKTYFSESKTTSVYFSSDDLSLPGDHPRRIFLQRSNGFITSGNFGEKCTPRRLHRWAALTRLVADYLGKNRRYIYGILSRT